MLRIFERLIRKSRTEGPQQALPSAFPNTIPYFQETLYSSLPEVTEGNTEAEWAAWEEAVRDLEQRVQATG